MKTFDYIIVGQGLAGSVLAWFLRKAGQKVLLIDNHHQGAASAVAAGIINPITGRRFVKSWRFDDLHSFAQTTYRQMEYHFDKTFFHKRNIVRVLNNNQEENDWLARSAHAEYLPYMTESATDELEPILQNHFGLAEITGSAQLDIPTLIAAFAKNLMTEKCLLGEKFDYSAILQENDIVTYKDYKAKKIIFCEGQQAQHNPFFNYLPFVPAKGEVLIAKITNFPSEKMLKHGIYIVPLKNKTYWIGATNQWDFEDDSPTLASKQTILDKLDAAIRVPYEILEHRAAIRPTVKDRRPFLGIHPEFPKLSIFNGLGTKGASLAPFWAKHFADFLLTDSILEKEVNIERFL